MEIENISNQHLICCDCLDEKKTIISNYEKGNIIDTNLQDLNKFMVDQTEFKFSREPILYTPDFSYVEEAYEEVEVESEIDPEEKIKSSWYHRAMIGDECREIYEDGQDTDFEEVEEFWRLKHEREQDDEDIDFNSQLVIDYK